MPLTIIYTASGMLLSRKPYLSWRDVQDDYPDYKTSLGPWNEQEVIEYLAEEYLQLNPSASEQVSNFLAGSALDIAITFS